MDLSSFPKSTEMAGKRFKLKLNDSTVAEKEKMSLDDKFWRSLGKRKAEKEEKGWNHMWDIEVFSRTP